MPRYIIRLTEGGRAWYLEWSTVVDAPVTFGMPLDEFRRYYRETYGTEGMRGLPDRLERAKRTGSSSMVGGYMTADDAITPNRAGPHETELSKAEIIDWYCKKRKDPE